MNFIRQTQKIHRLLASAEHFSIDVHPKFCAFSTVLADSAKSLRAGFSNPKMRFPSRASTLNSTLRFPALPPSCYRLGLKFRVEARDGKRIFGFENPARRDFAESTRTVEKAQNFGCTSMEKRSAEACRR